MTALSEQYAYLQPYDEKLQSRILTFEENRDLIHLDSNRWPEGSISFPWTDSAFTSDLPPVICEVWPYENEGWRWLEEHALPVLHDKGYNTIQLMARPAQDRKPETLPVEAFGTPAELCSLINSAHSMGIRVLFGAECRHISVDDPNAVSTLLSFLRHCLRDYHADGFRFNYLSTILYRNWDQFVYQDISQFFGENVNEQGILLMQLANEMVHTFKPGAITIAEDVSGMPGVAEPITDGGLGFDFRMAMGVSAMWRKLANERDENWEMEHIWKELGLRNGPSLASVENHVQVYEGCQTLMTVLAGMKARIGAVAESRKLGVNRGVALHKMIRLATYAAAGEGILTTIGTEGGCPDWPSTAKAIELMADPESVYTRLAAFDRELVTLLHQYQVLGDPTMKLRRLHNEDHVLAFERGNLLFVFNFHPCASFEGYGIPVSQSGEYCLLLSTDDEIFGGFGRVEHMTYPSIRNQLQLYLPARTGLVLAKA